MDTSLPLPRAPSEPLPELEEFLKPFHALFRRRESHTAMERYLTGLLTEHPVKNCDTLAAVAPGASEQQPQGLLTQRVWDEVALKQRRVQPMRSLKTKVDGVLIVDESGFAKQGQHPVGAARFPPRRDRRRQSLAAIHRQGVNRLLEAGLLEFIRRHQFLI